MLQFFTKKTRNDLRAPSMRVLGIGFSALVFLGTAAFIGYRATKELRHPLKLLPQKCRNIIEASKLLSSKTPLAAKQKTQIIRALFGLKETDSLEITHRMHQLNNLSLKTNPTASERKQLDHYQELFQFCFCFKLFALIQIGVLDSLPLIFQKLTKNDLNSENFARGTQEDIEKVQEIQLALEEKLEKLFEKGLKEGKDPVQFVKEVRQQGAKKEYLITISVLKASQPMEKSFSNNFRMVYGNIEAPSTSNGPEATLESVKTYNKAMRKLNHSLESVKKCDGEFFEQCGFTLAALRDHFIMQEHKLSFSIVYKKIRELISKERALAEMKEADLDEVLDTLNESMAFN